MTTLDTARAARDAGMASTESRRGADQDRQVIDHAIRTLAATGEQFSANDIRRVLPGVSAPLIGSRVLAASKRGQIERTGSELADHEEGHARRVSIWRAASSSKPVANTKQVANQSAPVPAVPAPAVSPEQARVIRDAHWALEARSRGKSGVHTATEACRVVRQLLDVLADLTGINSSQESLL